MSEQSSLEWIAASSPVNGTISTAVCFMTVKLTISLQVKITIREVSTDMTVTRNLRRFHTVCCNEFPVQPQGGSPLHRR